MSTLRVFDFDLDISGIRVVVRGEPISSACLSDEDIDAQIRLLKEDLDAVAARMKAAVHEQVELPRLSRWGHWTQQPRAPRKRHVQRRPVMRVLTGEAWGHNSDRRCHGRPCRSVCQGENESAALIGIVNTRSSRAVPVGGGGRGAAARTAARQARSNAGRPLDRTSRTKRIAPLSSSPNMTVVVPDPARADGARAAKCAHTRCR